MLNVPAKRSFKVHMHCAYFQQEQREREKQDLELAKEMAEDDDDFPWIQSFCCQSLSVILRVPAVWKLKMSVLMLLFYCCLTVCILVLYTPQSFRITNDPLWAGYGCFLELHNDESSQ